MDSWKTKATTFEAREEPNCNLIELHNQASHQHNDKLRYEANVTALPPMPNIVHESFSHNLRIIFSMEVCTLSAYMFLIMFSSQTCVEQIPKATYHFSNQKEFIFLKIRPAS